MDSDDNLNDDFLANLIRKVPLESPSDDFVNNVMLGIEKLPEALAEKRPSFLWFKSLVPFIIIGIILVFIFYSSDIPYLSLINGKEFFSALFVKTFQPFLVSMKSLFISKFFTYSLLIGVSAGFLFIIDKFFSRWFAV